MKAEVFETVPPDWQERTLDELCSLRKELVEPSSSGSNRYVGLEHIDPGIPRIRRWSNDADLRSTKSRFYPGDVLYGKLRPYLDKAALAEWEGVCSTDILTLSARNETADPRYLSFLFHTSAFVNHAVATTSGVNHPRTSWPSISTFTHPIAPLLEQRAIAAVLWKIQTAVELQEKIVTTLKELKAATMAKLFREGLRGEPLKQTEIGEIPESWEVVRLGDLVEVRGGKRLLKGESFADRPTNFPYIRVVDLKDNGVDTSDLRYLTPEVRETIKWYVITTKDIYISIAGTTGLVGVIPDTLDGANLTENAARLIIKDSKRIDRDFLMWFLAGNVGQEQISSLTGKTSQPKLALSRTETIKVPVPALTDEQLSIANLLNKQRQSYLSAASKRDTVKSLFSSMLHLLMTGQVRVRSVITEGGRLALDTELRVIHRGVKEKEVLITGIVDPKRG